MNGFWPLAVSLLAPEALAAEYETCGILDEPDCIETIQQAVDLAQDGDHIVVHTGVYPESVTILGKELTIGGDDTEATMPAITGLAIAGGAPAVTVSGTGAYVIFERVVVASSVVLPLLVEDGAWVAFTEGNLQGGSINDLGGVVVVRDAELYLLDSHVSNGFSVAGGGLIYAESSDLSIDQTELRRGTSFGDGGAVLFVDETGSHALRIDEAVFEENWASVSGGAIAVESDNEAGFSLVGSRFTENVAQSGGAFAVRDPLFTSGGGEIEDCIFESNEAEAGGALLLAGLVDVRTSCFSGNTAIQGGAVDLSATGSFDFVGTRFLDNRAEKEGALFGFLTDAVLAIRHCAFLGNEGNLASAVMVMDLAFMGPEGWVEFRDNLVAFNSGRGIEFQPVAVSFGEIAEERQEAHHNLWYGNGGLDVDQSVHQTDAVYGDPMVRNYVPDGTCERAEGLHSWYSPARDAGSEAGDGSDPGEPGGTLADIGPYGGPEGIAFAWTSDDDSDGWPLLYDCMPRDATVHPGALETPYDGVDANCDERSDFDADLDGYDSDRHGGTDCDDADPLSHPGAVEDPYDGVDQDCSGQDLVDVDGDGYPVPEDCVDTDPQIHPGLVDDDPDVDVDCDGIVDVERPLVPMGCASAGRIGGDWLFAVAGAVAVAARRRARRMPRTRPAWRPPGVVTPVIRVTPGRARR